MLQAAFLFGLAFVLAVAVTPRVAALAERFDLLDRPSARKVHSIAIPRIGGIAIFLSFCFTFLGGLFCNDVLALVRSNPEILYLFAGGLLAFLLGFYDDVKQLGPAVKFGVQILAALAAYKGGIKIVHVGLPLLGSIDLGWASLPVTVFWVLLVINAINLIDGLDGLAAGVSFFVCMVLLAVMLIHHNYLVAVVLACLAGSLLGFLVYNFNPASIFMGDSGSYFLGYMLASLSIFGSMKSHAAFTFLISIIALGVPLLDTVWATVRRFLMGQKLFYPDRNHFHHRLLLMGYSHRRAVVVLYGVTIVLGAIALLSVNVSDPLSAFLLGLLGILVVIFIQRLGYLNFLGIRSFLLWVNDLVNTIGLNRDRRMFLAHQLAIAEAEDMPAFWSRVAEAAKFLGLDYIEMHLGGEEAQFTKNDYVWHSLEGEKAKEELYSSHRLYMRFPLKYDQQHYGVLKASKKDFTSAREHSQTLWRLEFLRRTLSSALSDFREKPTFELRDRRTVPLGDRRVHALKGELLSLDSDRRCRQDRRRNGQSWREGLC